MKQRSLTWFFVFVSLAGVSVSGQVKQASGFLHQVHTFTSKTLGEERTVLVTLPSGYERSDMKYPVVVMLDAHEPQNAMMYGLLEHQAWGGKMPPAILVGIQNVDRVRDLTPTATSRPKSGGGPKFLEFIESEVIPLVDANYRTQPYRVFAGHSLGGLFVIYAFTEKPDLFDGYIAASPVLDWDTNFVIKRAEAQFRSERKWNKRMHVSLGDEPDFLAGYNSFHSLLKKTKPKDLDFSFEQFKDENHASVVLPAYLAGLRAVFDGWTLKQVGTLAEAEGHFKRLSDRLGITVIPSVNLLNRIAYELFTADRKDEAIAVFKRNTELHPTLPDAFENLAVAYEMTGRLKQAHENFEKAYQAALARKDMEYAKAAKERLDRLTEKLK